MVRPVITINTSVQWYGKFVFSRVNLEIGRRVIITTGLLKKSILFNISIPVDILPNGAKVRSLSGEFPRRDFGPLMNTMLSGVSQIRLGVHEGYVGTPLDYGVRLELHMNRSFLLRTFYQKLGVIQTMLIKPMRTK